MDIAGITNGHMQLYPHFVKNISQFSIGMHGHSNVGVGKSQRTK